MAQSIWFKRLKSETEAISPYIRFKKIKMGFYRIFYKNSYVHEVYEDMPSKGYDIIQENPRIERQEWYEEYEDSIDTIRNVKNFVEGYHDSIDHIRTRMWMHKHWWEYSKERLVKSHIS